MKILFIFDTQPNITDTSWLPPQASVTVFSLSGSTLIQEDTIALLRKQCREVNVLASNTAIDESVRLIRDHIRSWSARIGSYQVGSKKVYEWLLIPRENVSTWWLSLISEKNTFKSNVFFEIAQINAVRTLLTAHRFDTCVISIAQKDLRRALTLLAKNYSVAPRVVTRFSTHTFHQQRERTHDTLLIINNLMRSFKHTCMLLLRGFYARHNLPAKKQRIPPFNRFLFVTYFPALDADAARTGIFRNNYLQPLQDLLEKQRSKITWICRYVNSLQGYSFKEAVRLIKDFSAHEYHCILREEYFGIKNFLLAFTTLLRQIPISCMLYKQASRTVLIESPCGKESLPLIKKLWFTSLLGPGQMANIADYFIFKDIFKNFAVGDCVYLCEMQGWEKALNAAKRSAPSPVRSIGFQHTAFSKNYLSYYYDREELSAPPGSYTLPLPEVLAANGASAYAEFRSTGYPNVKEVEALRQIHITEAFSVTKNIPKGKPILFIPGAVKEDESIDLISLVQAASGELTHWDIRFKSHPAMPLEKIFKKMGIALHKAGYTLLPETTFRQCLKDATAVLVATSSVGIEALAYGCEVLIPSFADTMSMNPLIDFPEYAHPINGKKDLIDTLEKIAAGERLHTPQEYNAFVSTYWNLDSSLHTWRDLLHIDHD